MEGKAKELATLEQLMRENDELSKKLIEREEELNEAEKARVKEELAAIDAEENAKAIQKENERLKEEIIHLKAKLYDLIVK